MIPTLSEWFLPAGGLLLIRGSAKQAANRSIRPTARSVDPAELIENSVRTLIGQRVFAIALGYEDLNDHDELRRDPLMATLAGKLKSRRKHCAPVARKSTLNRLELPPSPHALSQRSAVTERRSRLCSCAG